MVGSSKPVNFEVSIVRVGLDSRATSPPPSPSYGVTSRPSPPTPLAEREKRPKHGRRFVELPCLDAAGR